MQQVPVVVSQRISEARVGLELDLRIRLPFGWKGRVYWNGVGWLLVPFGHADAW